jgi:hypothetical protein
MADEDELRKQEKNFIDDMTGLEITVVAGKIFGDYTVLPVAPKGAQQILDHIRGRGWKVTRV